MTPDRPSPARGSVFGAEKDLLRNVVSQNFCVSLVLGTLEHLILFPSFDSQPNLPYPGRLHGFWPMATGI